MKELLFAHNMAIIYSDCVLKPREVILFSQDTEIRFTEDFCGGMIITIGGVKVMLKAQDVLNAARIMGAKDIDIKIK